MEETVKRYLILWDGDEGDVLYRSREEALVVARKMLDAYPESSVTVQELEVVESIDVH